MNRLTASIVLLSVARISAAGPLIPSGGPIAPTHKTLTEIEPRTAINASNTPGDADSVFKITKVGSYYLTDDVMGEAGKHGIEVFPATFGTVTIDLKGFSLYGVAGSLNGVNASGAVNVRNGAAQGWGGIGVMVSQGILENLHVVFNGAEGIRALWGSTITNCVAEGNFGDGISVGDVTRVHGCISKGNGASGIHLDGACLISECVAYANDFNGIEGGLSTIRDCMLFSNGDAAIADSGFSIVQGNNIHSGGIGILAAGSRSRIEGNNISGCTIGIDVTGTGNIVIGNTCTDNGSNFEFPLGILNTVGEILSFPAGGVVTSHNPWANIEY